MTSRNITRKAATTTVPTVVEGQFTQEMIDESLPTSVPESELAPAVIEEIDELLGTTQEVPAALQIQTVALGEDRYPLAKFQESKVMQSLPKTLYYKGNWELLSTKTTAISYSRRLTSENKVKQAEYNQEYRNAVRDARHAATTRASQGYTVMVESVRPNDVEIIDAALQAGGSVIICTPIAIHHRDNASLKQYENYLLDGRMLVLSRTDAIYTNQENDSQVFGRWHTRAGDENHEMMASLVGEALITRCGAMWNSGVWMLAYYCQRNGIKTWVRDIDLKFHQILIKQYGCKAWNLKPVAE